MFQGDRLKVTNYHVNWMFYGLKWGKWCMVPVPRRKRAQGNLNKFNSNVKQTIRKGVNVYIVNYSVIILLTWNAIHRHAVWWFDDDLWFHGTRRGFYSNRKLMEFKKRSGFVAWCCVVEVTWFLESSRIGWIL